MNKYPCAYCVTPVPKESGSYIWTAETTVHEGEELRVVTWACDDCIKFLNLTVAHVTY